MKKHSFRIKLWRNIAFGAVLIAILGFVITTPGITTAKDNIDSYDCSYNIILTVSPYSTGSWCMQGGMGSQLYQANEKGIATFPNVCKGTYYFCDASGTVYTVVVDGTAINYYPVATSVRCPC